MRSRTWRAELELPICRVPHTPFLRLGLLILTHALANGPPVRVGMGVQSRQFSNSKGDYGQEERRRRKKRRR